MKIINKLIFLIILFSLSVAGSANAGVYQNNCTYHAYKDCLGNSVYWFNSCGNSQDLIQTCLGANQICKYGECIFYYVPAPAPIPKPAPSPAPSQPAAINLTAAFFSKKDANAVVWDKTTQITPNANIYFLAVIKNNSNAPADNVSVSANIPNEISLIGNFKIDDASANGDIVSGINISSIPANGTKTITFEGKTQGFTSSGDKQATINISAGGAIQSDTLTISLNPNQPAAVFSASAGSGFIEFLKRWYLWILVAIVMIFLFIVIFRRLSFNV